MEPFDPIPETLATNHPRHRHPPCIMQIQNSSSPPQMALLLLRGILDPLKGPFPMPVVADIGMQDFLRKVRRASVKVCPPTSPQGPNFLNCSATEFSRLQARGSDPIPSSPALRTSDRHGLNPQRGRARHPEADSESRNININLPFRSTSQSHFPSRSRAASPLPEERFVSVNAFKWLAQILLSPSFKSSSNGPYNRGDPELKFVNVTSVKSFCEAARLFPRQVYHNLLLLRLPMMYSSSFAGLELNSQGGRGGVGVDSASGTPSHRGSGEWVYPSGFSEHQGPAGVSGAAANRYDFWEKFMDSLLREWRTLNAASAILASCVSFPLFFPPFKSNGAEKTM